MLGGFHSNFLAVLTERDEVSVGHDHSNAVDRDNPISNIHSVVIFGITRRKREDERTYIIILFVLVCGPGLDNLTVSCDLATCFAIATIELDGNDVSVDGALVRFFPLV